MKPVPTEKANISDKSLWYEIKLILEPEQFKVLQQQAVSKSLSVSDHIREILHHFLESQNKSSGEKRHV